MTINKKKFPPRLTLIRGRSGAAAHERRRAIGHAPLECSLHSRGALRETGNIFKIKKEKWLKTITEQHPKDYKRSQEKITHVGRRRQKNCKSIVDQDGWMMNLEIWKSLEERSMSEDIGEKLEKSVHTPIENVYSNNIFLK
ncbi:hypothetical protein EVAR_70511_1 [Eumeta japonica]|uniref:Uncharacterized protein n=1 Tax=Eumeta variegata TaxID=151549 RepID=A0A4C1SLB9_EUMVA|nr:hypothetical protein EVAR_70511_1 [Eumeta japonica]